MSINVDERTPLICGSHDKDSTIRRLYIISGCSLVIIVLLIAATITFAVLYLNLKNKNTPTELPKWPPPSISPLGKYSRAAVAADNGYCSEIGRDTLLRGGNAVDAAIATLFCIGVMDPHSAGIGGGHFMTIYNASTERCYVVDARETAPAAATEKMYVNKWNESQIGWRAIAIPGELHGLRSAYIRFGGGVEWKTLIQPTIDLISEGIPTSNALANALYEKRDQIFKEPTMHVFINNATKDVFKAGEQIKTLSNFLETLQKLADANDPIQEFYNGSIARDIVKEFKDNAISYWILGAIITAEDLINYKSIIRDNDEVIYTSLSNGRHVCGPPPPSGSAVTQAILNILDGYEFDTKTFEGNVDVYHRFIEASKFAFAARSSLGDMAFVNDSLSIAKNITSPLYANDIRSRITSSAHPTAYYGGDFAPINDHGTTHITVMDADGNAVSVTSTINLYFGAMVRSESTGIIWNDEMDDFSTPGHPNAFGYPPSPSNYIKPGKRPQSSMAPIIIYDNNAKEEKLAIGGAGGSTIISGVAGVALHAMWLDENIKEALDAPRLHNQLQPNVTQYEQRFPIEYVKALQSRGHEMVEATNLTVLTAIERAADGIIYANSDFRKGTESFTAGY